MQKALPKVPGVYLFKDAADRIIYIGKAKNIQKRVTSYFAKQKTDWKIKSMLQEHQSVDYIATKTETEALLLEAQMIRDHQPKFNVLLKEGQPFVYILFTKPAAGVPSQVQLVRNKKEQGKYFGPFLHKQQARSVYRYLTETFRLNQCSKKIENGCLDYHIGLCAGSCRKDFDLEGYQFRLKLAQDALKKNHKKLTSSIQQQIATYNQQLAFEKAMHLQEYLENLDVILHTLETKFSQTKYRQEIERTTTPQRFRTLKNDDVALQLQTFLGLDHPIRTVDCFDISHFQSYALVGSCVRFTDGLPDKNKFRRFKIRTLTRQNDYAALQEIVARRYKYYLQGNADATQDLPDLVLIDGGKGQLHAVQEIIPDIPCISLAKREETVFGSSFPDGVKLSLQDDVGKLLIALRDYAHHFAISYHRLRRNKKF